MFDGFDHPHARMWDEDGPTVRVTHNPVQRAIRHAGLVRGERPWVLVADDVQKDDHVRLYEWTLMLSLDTTALSITETAAAPGEASHPLRFGVRGVQTDVLLGDATTPRKGNRYAPEPGDPLLLVRVLHKAEPGLDANGEANHSAPGYDARPSVRVETFEKKEALHTPGLRSYGLDRRLIVPSRSVAPGFRVLLYPHRHGDPLPVTTISDDLRTVTATWPDGRTETVELPPKDEPAGGVTVTLSD